MVGYRVYYSDRMLDSRNMEWEAMPHDDVQVVVLFEERCWEGGNYVTLLHSYDYYWKYTDEWGQTNVPGAIPMGASVKRGRLLDKGQWTGVYNRAYEDTHWP